jgi:hypothetical protein
MIRKGTEFTTETGKHAVVEAVDGEYCRVRIHLAPRRVKRTLFSAAKVQQLIDAEGKCKSCFKAPCICAELDEYALKVAERKGWRHHV